MTMYFRVRSSVPLPPGPRPVPAWLMHLASAFVVLTLATLVVVPPWFVGRVDAIRREIEHLVEPARVYAREQGNAIAREVAATRAFLVTGDERFLRISREERGKAEAAGRELQGFTRPLGTDVVEQQGRVLAAAAGWRVRQDELLSGEMSASRYRQYLPHQERLFASVLDEARSLDDALANEATMRRGRIRAAGRTLVLVVGGLSSAAMLASLGVAWLAWRERLFARAADRARQRAELLASEEASLRQIVRTLGATTSFREVVEQAAEHSVQLTRAFGAYVEKFDAPTPGSEVEIVAVAGEGVPALGTRVPYPGSLSEELMESKEPQVMLEVGAIGERMAPYLAKCCPGCSGLVVPLASGGEVLGTLALLRSGEQEPFTPDELALARALGDAASAALRRVLLVEEIDRERRARVALLESTDQGVYAIDTHGRVTLVNRAGAAMLGYAPDEMLGRNAHALMHHHHADGAPYPQHECPIFSVFYGSAGIRIDSEVLWRKDGTSFPAEYSARPIEEGGRLSGAVVSFSDITHRKRQEQEELAARAQAESAVHARDELLLAVSHDLRNPLGAILLSAESLLRRLPEGDERDRRKAEVIQRAASNMDRMIEDLLDVDRLEGGRLVVERKPLEVRPLLGEAIGQLRPHAERSSITLTCFAPDGLPPVLADKGRLLQILSNLVGNAVKFTPEGGAIAVSVAPTEGAVCFRIEDTGKGIPADQLPHIFDRHWQASRTDRRGLGLGLSIVKGLVEAHGGRIGVESVPGRGSTFHFTIPVA